MRRQRDRGSVSAMTAVLVPALILIVGLVVDGGNKLQAIDHADAAAEQAARMAAQELDGSILTGDRPQLAATAANQVAHDVLAIEDVTGDVSITGQRITVTTTATRPTIFLSIIGINTVTGTGQATVRLAQGTTTEVPHP